MTIELDVYSGKLFYKDIDFSFVFDGRKLKLIPPKDKEGEIYMWFMRPLGNRAYTNGNPVYIEDDYLIGMCNENGQKIIFLPKFNNIGSYNSVLIIDINAFVICQYESDTIDRIGFVSQEIDCIFPTNQALEYSEWTKDGIFSIKTKSFLNTTSEKQHFIVDDKKVFVHFGISRSISTKVGKPPLELHSEMFFEFEETNDYVFIFKLWRIARSFISYLCYRKNVDLSAVNISAPYKDGKHRSFATMHIVDKCVDNETEILEKKRYIKQEYINGSEGKILNDIAKERIYLRHLPDTYRSGRCIDAARFVMITAAFEWTFRKNYPNGVTKKTSTIDAEKDAKDALDKLIKNSTGKLKKIYKFLSRLIEANSLQNEIEQIGKDYVDIIDIFGNRLYSLNSEVLDYKKMGSRLAEQRNNFAHGNLDKDFIGLSLLDLVYLEYIIYAIQLKEYEINNNSIKKAINDLFGCSIAL